MGNSKHNNRHQYQGKKPSKLITEIIRYTGMGLGKVFCQLEYTGVENIPNDDDSGLIIASNHQTYLDPVIIGIPVKREMRYMAWDAVFEWKYIGPFIEKMGAFPMSLVKGGTQSSLKYSINLLEEGNVVVIFPEAEREKSDGKLLKFKTGAVKLAIETGAQILPVTIRGANNVWAADMNLPKAAKIKVHFHEPYKIEAPADKNEVNKFSRAETEKLRDLIDSV